MHHSPPLPPLTTHPLFSLLHHHHQEHHQQQQQQRAEAALLPVNLPALHALSITSGALSLLHLFLRFPSSSSSLLRLFFLLRSSPHPPSLPSFSLLAKALSFTATPPQAHLAHAQAAKSGALSSPLVRNSFISMYCRLSLLPHAHHLFDEMPLTHDPIPWNTMIAGYGRIGDARRAIQLFRRAPARNLVSWTAAIAACTNSSEHAQALALFLEMERTACFVLDVVILVSVLKACANLGELGLGRRLHRLAGGLRSARLAAALVDMYVKCGCLDEAARVFDAAGGAGRDVVLYNAMINGLALHGRGAQALRLFHEMKAAGAAPNESTFVAVLRACSHAGLVEEGRAAFAAMDELGVERRREHYGCFADMLSRAGLVEEAEEVVRTMPMAAEAAQWGAVMAGCRAHGDGAVATRVGRRLVAMEPQDGGRYVIMANTLAESGRWEDAGQARADMESNRARKEAGKSSLEPMF